MLTVTLAILAIIFGPLQSADRTEALCVPRWGQVLRALLAWLFNCLQAMPLFLPVCRVGTPTTFQEARSKAQHHGTGEKPLTEIVLKLYQFI